VDKTKKMPVSTSLGEYKTRAKEFLIPNPCNDGSLIGIKSGKRHLFGVISYIGVEISTQDIINKVKANKIDILDVPGYIQILDKYIDEIYKYRISNIIECRLDGNDKITLIKTANWSECNE